MADDERWHTDRSGDQAFLVPGLQGLKQHGVKIKTKGERRGLLKEDE